MPNQHAPLPLGTQQALQALEGGTFESAPFSVTEDSKSLFERATLLDEVYGPEIHSTDYPRGLVEGFHLLGLLDRYSRDFIKLDGNEVVSWNYGLERVRFIKPILIAQRCQLVTEIGQLRSRAAGVIMPMTCKVLVDDDTEPSMMAEWLAYFAPRSDGGVATA
jgi:hypothetical protein